MKMLTGPNMWQTVTNEENISQGALLLFLAADILSDVR